MLLLLTFPEIPPVANRADHIRVHASGAARRPLTGQTYRKQFLTILEKETQWNDMLQLCGTEI